MPSLKDIRTRIRSVKDVQQITKAMKMVAAAKLRKSEGKMLYCRQYIRKLETILFNLTKSCPDYNSPFLKQGENGKVGLLVLTGDKGLCGPFNTAIVKSTQKIIDFHGTKGHEMALFGIGKKGNYLLKRLGFSFVFQTEGIFGKVKFDDASRITQEITQRLLSGEISELRVNYTPFKSKMSEEQQEQGMSLLPLPIPDSEDATDEFLFEPEKEKILESLIPYYLTLKIFVLLLESETSEFMARMMAMDNAQNNSADLIKKLTLEFNRARQAAITKEILEITGGAEALSAASS